MNLNEKYRPKKLSDLIGRTDIVNTLATEYNENRMAQAYLFIGHYGSGKTSCARIIANMISGYTVEVDAASNNTSADMEQLIESVKQFPIGFSRTVLILDEIQNCGIKALSKLLIFLEKLPSHLTIIMCTTDGNKVPDTIKSRCECLTFRPLTVTDITERLKTICDAEKFEYEPKALVEIAKVSDGSMRVAISKLQTVVPKITLQNVRKIAECSYDNFLNLIYAVTDKDVAVAVTIVNSVQNANAFVEGFFSFLLDCTIYRKTNNRSLATVPPEYLQDLSNLTTDDMKHIESLIDKLLNLITNVHKSVIMKELLIANLLGEIK